MTSKILLVSIPNNNDTYIDVFFHFEKWNLPEKVAPTRWITCSSLLEYSTCFFSICSKVSQNRLEKISSKVLTR